MQLCPPACRPRCPAQHPTCEAHGLARHPAPVPLLPTAAAASAWWGSRVGSGCGNRTGADQWHHPRAPTSGEPAADVCDQSRPSLPAGGGAAGAVSQRPATWGRSTLVAAPLLRSQEPLAGGRLADHAPSFARQASPWNAPCLAVAAGTGARYYRGKFFGWCVPVVLDRCCVLLW